LLQRRRFSLLSIPSQIRPTSVLSCQLLISPFLSLLAPVSIQRQTSVMSGHFNSYGKTW
ncbi:hypothetical protein CI238_13486, partial [Colletotrichum incanum]